MRLCTVKSCKNKHYGKGFCQFHYQRDYQGKPFSDERQFRSKTLVCSAKGCKNKHWAKGFCGSHYASYRKSKGLYKLDNEYSKGNLDFEYKDRTNWSLSLKQYVGDSCKICGWKEASCDVHHILPVKDGGKNTLQNGIVLCPNDHKLADIGKLTPKQLKKINIKLLNQ